MGRPPCSDGSTDVKKGPWTPEENKKLADYIQLHGHGSWKDLPKLAGLNRCGKSCRLRWVNYLRPGIKRGAFDGEEEEKIIQLHSTHGNKWSVIATHLPGRTDNEIKNYWNTHLSKKLLRMGIDPATHRARSDLLLVASILSGCTAGGAAEVQADAVELARMQLARSIIQVLASIPSSPVLTGDLVPGLGRTRLDDQVIRARQLGPPYGDSGSSPQYSATDSVQSMCSSFQEMGWIGDQIYVSDNMPSSSNYGTDICASWDNKAEGFGEIPSIDDLSTEGFFK